MISRNLALFKANDGDPVHIGDIVWIKNIGECSVYFCKIQMAVRFKRLKMPFSYQTLGYQYHLDVDRVLYSSERGL